jgi:hypothetical protein
VVLAKTASVPPSPADLGIQCLPNAAEASQTTVSQLLSWRTAEEYIANFKPEYIVADFTGCLKALPNDFAGERQVVIVKREPTGSPYSEWCHFEERPGLAPPGSVDDACRVYLTEDDMAL